MKEYLSDDMLYHLSKGNLLIEKDAISKITLAQKLRKLRSKKTLAHIANKTGLSISYLSDLERGRTQPSLATLAKLSVAYRQSVVGILTGTEYDW